MEPEQTTSGKGPDAGRGDVETTSVNPLIWLHNLWHRSAAVGRSIVSLAGGLIAVTTLVLVAAIVIESLVEKTVTIRPLSVPKALSDDGISPEIVALDLRDGLNTFVDDVKRGRGWETTEVLDPEELPDVAVPSVGLSAQALAADVRAFFRIQNRTVISGEIVSHGDSYALTLRLNGRPFFHSPHGQPRDHLDDMIKEGVRATLEITQPAVAAAVAFDDGDKQKAIALCDVIIGKKIDPQDRHARTLKARALANLGRFPEAMAETQTIFKLYPKDAAPHNNLGAWLMNRNRRDEAVAEFRTAIALNPNHAIAHANLGRALLLMGRTDEAMKEFDAGIAIDPTFFEPHFIMATALRIVGRVDEALRQYRIAAPLSSKYAEPHRALGDAFRALGQSEEAAAEYQQAVALAPASAESHRKLALALDDLGRHGEASAERDAADAAERAANPRSTTAPVPSDPEKPKGPDVAQGSAPSP